MTRAGSVFGTPHYMSPEQAAGAAVDHRTDIYALGVILYEMASGKVPFDADNFMGILTQHMYKAPVPIGALVPEVDVPPGLDAIVLKCLTKQPEGRYASMDDLVLDLERLDAGLLPAAVHEMMARSGAFNLPADYFRSSAMPVPVPGAPPGRAGRWPPFVVVGAVGAFLGLVGIVVVARSAGSGGHALASDLSTANGSRALGTASPAGGLAVAVPAPPASAVGAAPATREVLVNVVPATATITRDGRDLGGTPIALRLAEGETATLVVVRKGYKTKIVTLGGRDPKQTIALEPLPPSPVKAPATARPQAGESPGALEDVGDPFKKR